MWVKLLLAHPKHGAAGKTLQLTEAVAKSLVEDGFAEATEAPAENATETSVKQITTTIVETVQKTVDERLKAFEESHTKSLSGAITKNFGALIPATAKDPESEKWFGFKSGAEFFTAVKQFSPQKEGAPLPSDAPEALVKATKAVQGNNTAVGSEGGYVCPPDFSNRVLEHAFKDSPLVDKCDRHSLSGPSLEFTAVKESSRATGSRRGGVRAYWLSEAEQFTKSKPTFRKFRVTPHKLGVFNYVTEEQLQDQGFGYNLESKLAQYAGEEMRFMIADAVFRGDGVGKPLGVLNAPATVTVAAEGGQTVDTINWANIQKMFTRMLPDSLPHAEWYINIDCLTQLLNLKWPDTSGTTPIWLPGSQFPNVSGAPFGALLGRPLNVIEHASSIGDLGDISFLDMRHYVLATKGGVNSAVSIHVRFDYEETCFRFSFRVDGQPWLESAVTPYKGASTLSPFVTLAAR